MKRESFVFYRSFYEATQDLEPEDYKAAVNGLVTYALDGVEPMNLSPMAKVIFTLIKPQIDANNKKYKNGCKGAKYGVLGAEYGSLGGRPKKTPQKPPKNPPNVNDNENENVNVNDNDECMNDKEKDISSIHSQMIRLMRM